MDILKLSAKRILFDLFVNVIGSSHLIVGRFRRVILVMCGIKTRSHLIKSKVYFSDPKISIGRGTFINNFCKFYGGESIIIGENIYIAMNCLFTANSHRIGGPSLRAGESFRKPITVGNGCWIGANTTILPGVTIGNGCVIAAGAVVTKDCDPNGLYVGVPAKRIKELNSEDDIEQNEFVSLSISPNHAEYP